MCYYGNDFDKMIKAERTSGSGKGPMSANEWRFNDSGSAEPAATSWGNIFAAYHDYRSSQQWN